MPPIEKSNYFAPTLLPTGHLQTLYPYFFRRSKKLGYRRLRIDTPDDDFLDMDISFANKSPSAKAVLLTHGLEGSSSSNYVTAMADYFNSQGFDAIAWNMRGCSGEVNKRPYFYHSGQIEDLSLMINTALDLYHYQEVYLVGFSLGAGMSAIYLGKMGPLIPHQVRGAVLFSTPCCLKSSGDELSRPIHKLYAETFLSTMRNKVLEKSRLMNLPGISIDKVRRAKNFREFDDCLTAPSFGYDNALDYYTHNSAKPYLSSIKHPTLIVNAKNDPFLGKDCYPIREAHRNPMLYLEMPTHGGHLGFYSPRHKTSYSELRAHEFISSINKAQPLAHKAL